jgi:hypothetical protein
MTLTVAASELLKDALRLLANANKRITRLAQKDIQGGDLVVERAKAEMEAIKSLPTSNYREIQTVAARARRLDQSAGTRAQSFQKAATRAYRDDLVDRAKDPFTVTRMTKDELAEVHSIQRSRLRDRLRRVRNAVGDNYMTNVAQKILDDYDPQADHNKLRSLVGRSSKALSSKTLSPKGAREQIQKGVEMFGDVYMDMTDEQRRALWDALHRQTEVMNLGSPEVAELVHAVMSDQNFKAMFFRSSSSGEMQAVIGQGFKDTKIKQKKAMIDDRIARNILRRGFERDGVPLPDFLLEDNEEDMDQPFFF